MNLRIAITVEEILYGEARVSDHFGRCCKFVVYDVNQDNKIINEESYLNPLQGNHGSACKLPYYIKEIGANVVIAGGMGSRAQDLFQKNRIGVIIGALESDPEKAVLSYLNNQLATEDNICDH